MLVDTVVELSRWQFAITAILHFLFIPLTLGLALLLAVMESAYVWRGRALYKAMAQFWGRVFAINFVLAVSTRLVLIFQFGLNGSYFAHYVGDVFALPLAIEALGSFFLAAALFGPYWFGWDAMGKKQHLCLTWLIALAVNVSAFWVLMANGWMQNPVGAAFNYQSYRIELSDFAQLLHNPAALAKYLHTVAASYVVACATVLGIGAYWLRLRQDDALARLSYKLAAGAGVLALGVTIGLGDSTPTLDNPVQQAKRAAISGQPDSGLLPGIEARIRNGMQAYALLEQLRDGDTKPQLLADFERFKQDLGYAMLLQPLHKQIDEASDKHVKLAAQSALPAHPGLLRGLYLLMIGCGIVVAFGFVLAVWGGMGDKAIPDWLLSISIYLAPLPWLASVAGWFVAEAGKQPWAVAGLLPTFWAVSSQSVTQLLVSSVGFSLAYLILLGLAVFLLRQTVMSRRIVNKEA
jgi:Cytochrome bd-type quinol oxidase, subunit 1